MAESNQTVASLMAALKSPDGRTRVRAVLDLASFPSPAIIEALIDRLRDMDAEVREAASDALAKIGSAEVVAALAHAPRDPVTWKGVARSLSKIASESAVAVLADALYDHSSDVWSTASFALADAGPAAAPALTCALAHEAPSVRARAAMALGRARVIEAIDALLATTKDVDASVRMEAVVALAALQDDRAIPVLVEALNDPEESVRQSVPVALGEIGSERAIEALKQATHHEDEAIRWIAEWQLNEMGITP